jgi:hypothetical protein
VSTIRGEVHAKLYKDKLIVSQEVFGTNLVGVDTNELWLYYHEEAYGVKHNASTSELAPLPKTPEGYSGAGVWRFLPHGHELFSPQRHVKLFGIQYAWGDITRRLKCVPASVIVDILKANYPDLRDRLPTPAPEAAKPNE